MPEECTEEVRELIDLCMRTNVNERPSAMDIVNRLQVILRPTRAQQASLITACFAILTLCYSHVSFKSALA